MFSKACEHGIKAIIYIATQSMDGKRVKIGDVVENSGSPEAFTAKVLGSLTKYHIVNSYTGPNGGFFIDVIYSFYATFRLEICNIKKEKM